MTFRNFSIEKLEQGFRLTDHREPKIATYPFIPKRRHKALYPFILIYSGRVLLRYRAALRP